MDIVLLAGLLGGKAAFEASYRLYFNGIWVNQNKSDDFDRTRYVHPLFAYFLKDTVLARYNLEDKTMCSQSVQRPDLKGQHVFDRLYSARLQQ